MCFDVVANIELLSRPFLFPTFVVVYSDKLKAGGRLTELEPEAAEGEKSAFGWTAIRIRGLG